VAAIGAAHGLIGVVALTGAAAEMAAALTPPT
jgi:hypothetical protein